MKKAIFNFLKFLVFLGIGVGILYLVYRGQNAAFQEDCALRGVPQADCSLLRKVVADFRGADFLWILLTLIAFTISNVSRALRWNMLIYPLGHRPRFINAFLSTVLGYFANLGLPRMGEVVRAGTMARYERIPVEKVMGTIVVDRIVDVLSILLVTALALILQFGVIMHFVDEHVDLKSRFGDGSFLIYGMGGLLLLALLFLVFRKSLARSSLFERLKAIALGFKDGLLTIRRLERPWLFIAHSLNIWIMYFSMTYLCFWAFEPTSHLSLLVGLVVFVFGGWGMVVPSPGGMGTYHFMVQTALQIYGISGDDAFSWANISFFSIQLGCNVVLGILALIAPPLLNRNYHPEYEYAEAY